MGDVTSYYQMFDYLSDLFETVEWSKNTLIEVGNTLIQKIAFDSNSDNMKLTNHLYDQRKAVAAMLNALYTLVQHHNNVEDCLDYTPIIPYIKTYGEECTDTILYLLACTGNMKYMELIEKEAARFSNIPIEEYRTELKFRADKFRFMSVILARYRCIVNYKAIVLLTEYQKSNLRIFISINSD